MEIRIVYCNYLFYFYRDICPHLAYFLHSLPCSFSSEVFENPLIVVDARFSVSHNMFDHEQCQIITWTQSVNVLGDGESSLFPHVKNRVGMK